LLQALNPAQAMLDAMLVECWSNTGQILVEYWSNTGQRLNTLMAGSKVRNGLRACKGRCGRLIRPGDLLR
jgi:hypothetical protein